jgi:hypothetical protein
MSIYSLRNYSYDAYHIYFVADTFWKIDFGPSRCVTEITFHFLIKQASTYSVHPQDDRYLMIRRSTRFTTNMKRNKRFGTLRNFSYLVVVYFHELRFWRGRYLSKLFCPFSSNRAFVKFPLFLMSFRPNFRPSFGGNHIQFGPIFGTPPVS